MAFKSSISAFSFMIDFLISKTKFTIKIAIEKRTVLISMYCGKLNKTNVAEVKNARKCLKSVRTKFISIVQFSCFLHSH
jgi:hypothetical protein